MGGRLWVVNVDQIHLWILSQLLHVSLLIKNINIFNLCMVTLLLSIVICLLDELSIYMIFLFLFLIKIVHDMIYMFKAV